MNLSVANLVYIIISVVEALTVGQYFSGFGTGHSNRKQQALALLTGYVIVYLTMFLSENTYLGFAVFFMVNYLLGHFFYDIPLKTAAWHAGILLALLLFAQWIVAVIMKTLLVMTSGNSNAFGYLIFVAVFTRLLWLLFVEILIAVIEWHQEERQTGIVGTVLTLCLASISTCLGVSVLIYLELTQTFSGIKEGMLITGALSMLLTNVIIYWNSIHSRRRYKNYMDLQRQLEKESADAAYYSRMAEYSEEQKILIHDIRKHLNMMDVLLQNQEYDRVSDYLHEIQTTPGLQKTLQVSDNSMANLILTDYRERCRQKGIRLYLDIRTKCVDFLTTRELTALFANLLDNAMEAAEGMPEAFIELRVSRRSKMQVLLQMKNSCKEPPLEKENGVFLTKKADTEKHGFGMKSIDRILKSHNGMIDTRYDAEKQIFCTVLIMSVSQ